MGNRRARGDRKRWNVADGAPRRLCTPDWRGKEVEAMPDPTWKPHIGDPRLGPA